MQRSLPRLRDVRHRRRVRCPTSGTASSPCTAACCTRCTTAATAPTAASTSAPASSATSWAPTTRTATPRSTTPWSASPSRGRCGCRWSTANGNFGSPGNDPAAAMRYTECKLAPLAMEMLRDIDEETVDFQDNYDGRNQEPTVLPARFPNLLVNGSAGIAVGMATNIPPHNLREVAAGAQWSLENPEASHEELLDALIERIKGPDFPTGALVVGRKGIEEAYRTGRGSITMRAVVEVEEIQNRQCLVVTELPYQVNPDNLAQKIADLVKDGKVGGIADVRDETSSAYRPAPGDRAQARRRRQGRAEQPLQAHRAADELRREHAGAGRRRAAHAVARRVHPPLGDAPDRGHRPPYAVPAAQGRGAGPHPARSAQGAGRDRRGHRADPAQRHRRDRARGPDGPAGDRRDPGQRHPRDAAAPAGRPGAPEDRRTSTTSCRRRSPSTTRSWPRRSASAASSARSWPRSSRSSATTGAPSSSPSTATCPSRT